MTWTTANRLRLPQQCCGDEGSALMARLATCFVYGSLMSAEVLHELLGRVPVMRAAVLKGFRRHALFARNYPGIVPDAQASVHGQVLFALQPKETQLLDLFEDEYTKEAVQVAVEGESAPLDTNVYVYARGHEGALLGDWDYAQWRREHLQGFLASTREFAAQHR